MHHHTALSIVAPNGTNIATGRKTLEVRSWQPPTLPLRDLVIVENQRFLREPGACDPDGRAVAVVDVVAVGPWTPEQVDAACSSGWAPGYFAWQIANVRPIGGAPSVPAARGLYTLTVDGAFETGVLGSESGNGPTDHA